MKNKKNKNKRVKLHLASKSLIDLYSFKQYLNQNEDEKSKYNNLTYKIYGEPRYRVDGVLYNEYITNDLEKAIDILFKNYHCTLTVYNSDGEVFEIKTFKPEEA